PGGPAAGLARCGSGGCGPAVGGLVVRSPAGVGGGPGRRGVRRGGERGIDGPRPAARGAGTGGPGLRAGLRGLLRRVRGRPTAVRSTGRGGPVRKRVASRGGRVRGGRGGGVAVVRAGTPVGRPVMKARPDGDTPPSEDRRAGRVKPGPAPGWAAPSLGSVLARVAVTRAEVGDRFPLYADPCTGSWRTTARGSWTGGFWAGLLWLRARHTGDPSDREAARACTARLADWAGADTSTRGLILWYGTVFADDGERIRYQGARACRDSFDPELGLVPWGSAFGGPRLTARVDGVPGMVPLLAMVDVEAARSHLRRHLDLCLGSRPSSWSWLHAEATGWTACADPPPG